MMERVLNRLLRETDHLFWLSETTQFSALRSEWPRNAEIYGANTLQDPIDLWFIGQAGIQFL